MSLLTGLLYLKMELFKFFILIIIQWVVCIRISICLYRAIKKKKIRVGENGGLNQSKHQNSTIQVTRFFFN
jgi:hypothetical protein